MVNEFNQVVLQVVLFLFSCFRASTFYSCVYFEKQAIVCFSHHRRFATYSIFLHSALLRCYHVPYQFPASQAECLRWSSGRNKAGSGRACPTISATWIQPHQGTSLGWNRDVSACGTWRCTAVLQRLATRKCCILDEMNVIVQMQTQSERSFSAFWGVIIIPIPSFVSLKRWFTRIFAAATRKCCRRPWVPPLPHQARTRLRRSHLPRETRYRMLRSLILTSQSKLLLAVWVATVRHWHARSCLRVRGEERVTYRVGWSCLISMQSGASGPPVLDQ